MKPFQTERAAAMTDTSRGESAPVEPALTVHDAVRGKRDCAGPRIDPAEAETPRFDLVFIGPVGRKDKVSIATRGNPGAGCDSELGRSGGRISPGAGRPQGAAGFLRSGGNWGPGTSFWMMRVGFTSRMTFWRRGSRLGLPGSAAT